MTPPALDFTIPAAGSRERERSSRERLVPWLMGAALAALALALPQERLVGEAFAGHFEHSPLWAIWHRFGRSLGSLLGLSGERARFVLAALAYGASLPVAAQLARSAGAPFRGALTASAIVLLAPTAWIAGTTPGMTSVSLLLLLLTMRALRSARTRGRPWVGLGLWSLLVGTQVSGLLLWPAIAWALLAARNDPVARRRSIPIVLMAGLGFVALVAAMSHAEWDPVPLPTQLDLDATRWSIDRRAWLRLAGIVPGLGLALLGLARSVRPAWLTLWCLAPVAALLQGSTLTWDASYHWLLPVALLGLEGRRLALLWGTLLAQLALLLGFQAFVTRTDPLRTWREQTRAFHEPLDTVITGDMGHAYLSSHRFGLRSVFLRASDPEHPSTDAVDGIYADPDGLTNLRVKTQDVAAWADEGIEAHGFGFRVVLDRPFPDSSKAISEALEHALHARVDYWPIGDTVPDTSPPPFDKLVPHDP